jgi:hypothetical protein
MERRLIGAVSGASNRGAPRGARAQKQPDSAPRARQHNAATKVRKHIRRSQTPTSKSQIGRYSLLERIRWKPIKAEGTLYL